MSLEPESNPYASPRQCDPATQRPVRRPWLILLVPLLLAGPLWFVTKPYVENLPGQQGKPLNEQQNESRLLRMALIASLAIVYWFGSALYLSYVGWLRPLTIFLAIAFGLLMIPAMFALIVFAITTLSPFVARATGEAKTTNCPWHVGGQLRTMS